MLQRIFSNDIMGLPKSGEDGQAIDKSIITDNSPEDVEAREKAPSPSPSIHGIIKQYLFDRVPEFRKLDALRQKVKKNSVSYMTSSEVRLAHG